MIESIVILGAGNVAWHLLESFTLAGLQVQQVFGRNQQEADVFEAFGDTKYITDINDIDPSADIYFICVNDDAIVEIAGSLPFILDDDQILVHTSGGQFAEILSPYAAHYGSFWPLQSLTKEAQILSNEIPVIITASDDFTKSLLILLADAVSANFTMMTDEKKQELHLAAVLVNNFTNHLYTLTSEYCSDHGLDFYLLSSLIKETSLKAAGFDPSEIQTGPARRNDKTTIEKHLTKLEGYPDLYKLYCLFTESIIHKYHKE
jgi:predicted short-subunit dehydrogenase-like oxidoreductase (DUF2520 family)